MIIAFCDVDIPQLPFSGIQYLSFIYTHSLQSSSNCSSISSSFDATALQMYITFRSNYIPHNLSRLVLESSSDLVIPNNYFNGVTSFNISDSVNLRRIEIGNDTFGSVRVFELNGLSELESVVIGEKSFTYAKDSYNIRYSKQGDGTCRIVNCPKLKSIQIGGYSFGDYHSFKLTNLISLESIVIGEWCFYWAPSFSLTGLID